MNEAQWQTQIQVKSRSARIIFPGQPGWEGGEGRGRNEMDKTQQNKTEHTGVLWGSGAETDELNKTKQDKIERTEVSRWWWCKC